TAINNGLTVTSGSEILATGSQGGRNLTVNGDGALIRVSNGAPVTVTRTTTANKAKLSIGTQKGTTTLAAGANVLIKGNSIAIDTSGTGVFAADIKDANGKVTTPGVTLAAVDGPKNVSLSGSQINLIKLGINAPTSTAGALTISADFLNSLAGANSVTLRS